MGSKIMGLMDTVYLRQKLDRLGIKIKAAKLNEADPQTYNQLLLEAQQLETKTRFLNIPDFIAVCLMRQGDIFTALQQYDQAINVLERALETLGEQRKQDIAVYILGKLAEIYAHCLEWDKVLSVCQQGIEFVEKYRYSVNRPYLQSAYLRFRISLYTLGILAAYKQKNYDLVLAYAELSKCRFALRYQDDRRAGNKNYQETSEQFQQICEEIDRKRQSNQPVESLLLKRRQIWDLLMSQRFQARSDQPLPQFNLETVKAILDEDEAIIYYYWLDENRLLIVTIDQQDVITELKNISDNEKRDLEKFSSKVLKPINQFNEERFRDALLGFSQILLPQDSTNILNGKQRLLISPHRLLHIIPFNFLTWNDQFLVENFALTYIPNLSSLLLSYSPLKQQKILAIGITEYKIQEQDLKPLTKAEQEVTDIQNIYKTHSIPITILIGEDATEENLRKLEKEEELKTYSCLHFAVHGNNIESDTPMESHLFLRNSLLDGLEISNWELKADTIVLSACHSGQRAIAGRGMKELPGDELFGLQAAFFTAGVKRIISGLWTVDSYAALPITKEIHSFLVKGESPDIALQNALKSYLKREGELVDINLAAPFFLVAIGRPFPVPQNIIQQPI